VPRSKNRIHFSLEGPGQIVATDNGDPTSFESFQSHERNAFNGLCLAIVRGRPGQAGTITVKAQSEGLQEAAIALRTQAQVDDRKVAVGPGGSGKAEGLTDGG
jgi:beta-galactosidase